MSERIISQPSTDPYRDTWERVFGTPETKEQKNDDTKKSFSAHTFHRRRLRLSRSSSSSSSSFVKGILFTVTSYFAIKGIMASIAPKNTA